MKNIDVAYLVLLIVQLVGLVFVSYVTGVKDGIETPHSKIVQYISEH
jgi:Flp pilus assembly pilin Flp